ncbi:MAG: DUF488 domain-containing protein [Thermoleophilia bacterium]|nr:DUF488 domain-containing protein [Thermoleophilia bacterium]
MNPGAGSHHKTSIWTIGHSTHSFEEFVALLGTGGIRLVADVRSVPRSRHVPQFNREELAAALPAAGVEYLHMKDLGGWRRPVPDSVNSGWRSLGFRGYADYMQTDPFRRAATELISHAAGKQTAVMCAEGPPFRCHRLILSDYLVAQGVEVRHIYPDGSVKPHQLTRFAVIGDGRVTYPPEQGQLGE